MAFPFADGARLRQQILIAIGSSGLLGTAAAGCTARHPPLSIAGTGQSAAGSPGAGSAGMRADASVAGAGTSAAAGRSAMLPDAGITMCRVGFPAQRECFDRSAMQSKAMFGCGQSPITPVPSAAEISAKFSANGCLKREVSCDGCCNPSVADGEPQADGSCCYSFCSGACCGRPFIVAGEARSAAVMQRGDWLNRASVGVEPASLLAQRIGSEWLEDARMEHASIASFARFTFDLLAYGAPADLLEMAQHAALDEVEHARLCFGLAARYSGLERGPAPLLAAEAQVAASLWDAALAAFREGCVGETLAALQARAAFDHARDPEVRRALERIADDEARHAQLAWRFVAWAVRRVGPALGEELQRQVADFSNTSDRACSEHETDTVREALHAAGRLTSADKQQLTRAGLRDVVAACAAALTDRSRCAVTAEALQLA